MKTVNSTPFIAIVILLIVNSGCVKDNTAPILNAGNDQDVFLPVDFCTLNGVVQDRENNIQTISWSKISGPSSFVIEHPGSLSTKVSNLEIGVYQFELTVTDDGGLYGKDIIQVTVNGGGNTAPISNAGQDIVIFFPTNFCTLFGNAHDIENNIRTILWSKISGPSSFLIEDTDSLSTKLSNLQAGVYQFELTVTDSIGLYGKDTVNVTVNGVLPSPNAPRANAGPDKLVYYPATFINLYGSMSAGGNIIQTISWSMISGPSSFFIETPNSLGTKLSNLQTGVYQLELLVQDAAGLTDKDTCSVIVGQLSPIPNEVIITDQVWVQDGLLWGSGITVNNIYQYVPPSSVFRVYIKKDNSTNWEELLMDDPNSWYNFSLLNGNLFIYSNYDENDTPDIKLVY
jgi:hypothetical protein